MKSFKWRDNLIWDILSFLLLLFGGLLLGNAVVMALESLLHAMAPSVTDSPVWQDSLMYLPFIGIWLMFFLMTGLRKRDRRIIVCLSGKLRGNTPRMLLIGLGIGFGMNLFCALTALLHGDIALRFNSFHPLSLLWLFLCVFIQSAAEELICRCYFYQRLMRRYNNFILAAVLNAALFSLVHSSNPGVSAMALLNIFLYGILFSAVVYYMDSLWAAFAIHAAWNFCQNFILGLPNSGLVSSSSLFSLDAATATNSFAYDIGFGVEATVVASFILLCVLAVVVYRGRKNTQTTNIWLEDATEKEQ